jgi:hypothetical protein
VLQNRHALDLLTAEKGGICLFLNKEVCFYSNKSGVVRDMAWQLKECVTKRRQELANLWSFWNNIWSWAPWALPLAGPLFMLLLIFLFGPCIINALSRFISQQPTDQIPALSQGILTSAYAWALHPVLSGASGDYRGQPLRQVPPHLPHPHPIVSKKQLDESSLLSPRAVGYLSQRGDLLGLGT